MHPTRRRYLKILADIVKDDDIVVSCLGDTSIQWHDFRPRDGNFYLADSMGQAVPVGVGMAVARPDRKVVVLEGDGAMLMNLGSLVTAGSLNLRNLMILVFNNGIYQASGGQPLPVPDPDFEGLAKSAGLKLAATAASEEDFKKVAREFYQTEATSFISMKTDKIREKPERDFTLKQMEIRARFTSWIAKLSK